MSIVGPRPEVPKYVKLYTDEERIVLTVKPGITDWASLKYFDENELLERSNNPEKIYIEEIMKDKLELNKYYIINYNLKTYFQIIKKTAKLILFNSL